MELRKQTWRERLRNRCVGVLALCAVTMGCGVTPKPITASLPKPMVESRCVGLLVNLQRKDLPEPSAEKMKGFSPLPQLSEPYSRLGSQYLKAAFSSGCRDGEIREFNPTNSFSVLSQLPYDAMIQHLGLAGRENVHILYPAAGSHIAALEIGIQLQQRLPSLGKVEYIFTEVKKYYPEVFQAYAAFLNPEIQIIDKDASKYDAAKGKGEIKYSLKAFGRDIEVMYALNMSEAKDHSYFKKSYAQEADIVLFHDSGLEKRVQNLSDAFVSAAAPRIENGKTQVIVSEAPEPIFHFSMDERNPLSISLQEDPKLPGMQLTAKGHYGCGKNPSGEADIYLIDNKKMLELKQNLQGFYDLLVSDNMNSSRAVTLAVYVLRNGINDRMKLEAAEALGKIAEANPRKFKARKAKPGKFKAKEAIPDLIKEAVPDLVELVRMRPLLDPSLHREIRITAMQALAKIAKANPNDDRLFTSIIDVLNETLKSKYEYENEYEDVYVRSEAGRILRTMNKEAIYEPKPSEIPYSDQDLAKASSTILKILKKENDTEFSASLVQALGALAEHRVLETSQIAAVRNKATTLLSQIQKEASYPELISGVYLKNVGSLTTVIKNMDKL